MPAIAWRIIYVVLAVIFLSLAVPLLFTVLGISVSGAAYQLIKLCLVAIAICYIIWGGPIK